MAHVQFTPALRRFAPALAPFEAEATTVAELLLRIEERFPGLRAYLVDERGALRQHVNIFIGEDLIHDKLSLSDALQPTDEVYILQSLSGG